MDCHSGPFLSADRLQVGKESWGFIACRNRWQLVGMVTRAKKRVVVAELRAGEVAC